MNRKSLKADLSLAKLNHQAQQSEISAAAVKKAEDALQKCIDAEADGTSDTSVTETPPVVPPKEKTAKAPTAKKNEAPAQTPVTDAPVNADLEAIQAAAQSAEGSADRADESADRSDTSASDAEDFAGQAEEARDIAVDAAEKAQAASEVAKKN